MQRERGGLVGFLRAWMLIAGLPGLIVAPIAGPAAALAQPAAADDDDDDASEAGPRTLATMIAERDRDQMDKAAKTKKTGGILAVVVGAGTAFACGAGRGKTQKTNILCSLAGVAAAYTVTLITNNIAKKLVEKDQKQVLAAAGQSLRTGEPQQLELPASSASASVSTSGQPVLREATVNLFYDTVRVADLSKITVIAEPYKVTKANTLLRAAPSATAKVSAKLPANQPLYVSGQVANTPWYMVSERVVEGEESAMMAVGYVESKELAAAPPNFTLPGKAPPTTMARKDVLAVLKCDTVGFKVRDAKGKESNGTSELCRGPEGTPISA